LEKAKKDQNKQKNDYEGKIKALNEKVNTLQTNFENTKTDLAYLHKVKKGLTTEKEAVEKDVELMKKRISQKEDDLADNFNHINEFKEQARKKDLEFE